MPTINDGQPLRLEQGGKLRLEDMDDADAAYEAVNRDKGTVQLEDGWFEPLRYNDRGQMQVPLEGDERPSTFRATLKLTSADADELLTLAQQIGATGLMRKWRVQVVWPRWKGETTNPHTATIENAYFLKPVQVTEGQEFDTVTIEMEASEALWTLEYTPPEE